MITINKRGGQIETSVVELFGLSTDEKPVDNIPNGSSFYEMDTKNAYLYDETNKIWLLQ